MTSTGLNYRYLTRNYVIPDSATAPPFTPLSLPGLTAWYDASDTSSITASSNQVSQWNDKSGNGWNVTQATGVNQPLSGTRTLNGLNVVDFDGTNDILDSASFTLNQPNGVIAVILNDSGADGTLQTFLRDRAGGAAVSSGKETTNTWRISGGTALTGGTVDTSAHVFTALFNGASSQAWIDGASILTGNASTNGVSTGIRMAASNAGLANWNGPIAELILTSALATVDRQLAEAYLKAKWGTP